MVGVPDFFLMVVAATPAATGAAGLADVALTAVAAIRAADAAVGLRAVVMAAEVTLEVTDVVPVAGLLAAVTLTPSELARVREGLSLKAVEGTEAEDDVDADAAGSLFLRLSLGVSRGLAKDILGHSRWNNCG